MVSQDIEQKESIKENVTKQIFFTATVAILLANLLSLSLVVALNKLSFSKNLVLYVFIIILSEAIILVPLRLLLNKYQKILDAWVLIISENINNMLCNIPAKPINYREFKELDVSFAQVNEHIAKQSNKLAQLTLSLNDFSQKLNVTTRSAERGVSLLSRIIQDVARGTSNQEEEIHNITMDMQKMMEIVQDISDGAGDQVFQLQNAVNLMMQNEKEMLELATTSEYQAGETNKARTIIHQISDAMSDVSHEANEIAKFASQTSEVAKKGESILSETILSMVTIHETVMDSAQTIKNLGESSMKISNIIEFIDDISKQTNLLSVNAAIEAARAGEHGRGFAVVADEVRKLAERSNTATKEIAHLVSKIQLDTNKAIDSMDKGTSQVKKGSALATEASHALKNIMEVVKNTVVQIESISAASQQVTASSVEVVALSNNIAEVNENSNKAIHDFSISFQHLVQVINMVKDVSFQNQARSKEMGDNYLVVNEKSNTILDIAKHNSNLSKEANDSNQKMGFFMEKFNKHLMELSGYMQIVDDKKENVGDSLELKADDLLSI